MTAFGDNSGNAWPCVSSQKSTTGFTIALRQAGVCGSASYNASETGGGNMSLDVLISVE